MQLARSIFLEGLDTMKKILDLGEYQMKRESKAFKFYKKEVMKYTYTNLKKLFEKMKSEKVLQKCKCNADLKNGYTDCKKCNGAGYVNLEPEFIGHANK